MARAGIEPEIYCMIAGYLILCAIMAAKFFARVIVLWLYREPQPQKNQKSPHQRPQTPLAENLNPKNPIQDSNPITPNHHK